MQQNQNFELVFKNDTNLHCLICIGLCISEISSSLTSCMSLPFQALMYFPLKYRCHFVTSKRNGMCKYLFWLYPPYPLSFQVYLS